MMRGAVATVAFGLSVVAPGVAAQQSTSSPAPPATTSTRAGVYSAAQADRGRVTYAGMCHSCHTPASHTGATFEKLWVGRTLADLFGYMTAQMPKNDPGSLSPDQYADVMAYLLKMNKLPPGKSELPADSTSLASIRIETLKKAPARTPVRKPGTQQSSPASGD